MPMDRDDLDASLHNIEIMVTVAIDAADSMIRSDLEPDCFKLPAADVQMLAFAMYDLRRRVTELVAKIDASDLGMGRRAAAIPLSLCSRTGR